MSSLLKKLFNRKLIGFVSRVDVFGAEWDASHPKTASQMAEIKKYKRVYALRDTAAKQEKTDN